MSYTDLEIHQAMLQDRERTEGFERAIRQVVRPGDRVLDFGCGTGILSFFAARAGAERVHAVERTSIIKVARAVAERNGIGNIRFHHDQGQSLSEPVEVIVSEWMGHFALAELMLDPLIALRDRHLVPGGTMIPSRVHLRGAWVTDPEVISACDYFRQRPYDVDFGPVGDWLYSEVQFRRLREAQVLADRLDFGGLDLTTCTGTPGVLEARFTPSRDAVAYALAGWFDATLCPEISLSTAPGSATHWNQVVFPLPQPWSLRQGEELRVEIRPLVIERAEPTAQRRFWRWSISGDGRRVEMNDLAHRVWLDLPLPDGELA